MRLTSALFGIIVISLTACCPVYSPKAPPPNQNVVAEPVNADDGRRMRKKMDFLTPDHAAILGSFRLQLLAGGIGKLKHVAVDGKIVDGAEDRLWVKIKITNTSATQAHDYQPWSCARIDGVSASIMDEHRNRYYLLRAAAASRPVGQLDETTRIEPAMSIEDLLIFSKPLGVAKEFAIDFPGSALGHRGERIVYKVPAAFFDDK